MPRITLNSPLTDEEREACEAAVATGDVMSAAAILQEVLQASQKAGDEFATFAKWYNVNPDAANTVFESRGRKFRVTGFSTKNAKFPILGVEVNTGKPYKFTHETAATINAAYDKTHA